MMNDPQAVYLDPMMPSSDWAQATFGDCTLGDRRSVERLVGTAARLASAPDVGLSRALQSSARLKGAYRLFRQPFATLAAITAPHRSQTLAAAGQGPGPVLFVQDTSEFDYTRHPKTQGLGPIGNGGGRGFLVQSVLAVRPGAVAAAATVLGVAHVEAFNRLPAPRKNETSAERRARTRESDCWLRATAAVGTPPDGQQWVLVGDRGADIYRLFVTAREVGQDVLVRAAQDRRAEDEDGLPARVLAHARKVSACGLAREIAVPATRTSPARSALISVGWTAIQLQPPAGTMELSALPMTVIRAWEATPPPGAASVEWVLLSTIPVTNVQQAWERVEWYRHRWIVEEYHQALKTGCRVEAAQLREQSGLHALLGVCVPIAVRLLQLRMVARTTPEAPATTVFDAETVVVVAALTETPVAGMTVASCAKLIARLGGHQGRKCDGQPGWRTLWAGWSSVQTVMNGVRLAPKLHPP